MTLRKKRLDEFRNNNDSYGDFSANLLHCACTELESALHDRSRRHFRTQDNHYTPHAIGSFVLLVAGLESWLNETVAHFSAFDENLKGWADKPIVDKYKGVPKGIFDPAVHDDLPMSDDFQMVIDLRHEMVHWLPRNFNNEKGNVPPRFVELHRKGLLITAQNKSYPKIDFLFEQKLASYKLVYWAWETVETAVKKFLDALGAHKNSPGATKDWFSIFRDVCPPHDFPKYDAEHHIG